MTSPTPLWAEISAIILNFQSVATQHSEKAEEDFDRLVHYIRTLSKEHYILVEALQDISEGGGDEPYSELKAKEVLSSLTLQ